MMEDINAIIEKCKHDIQLLPDYVDFIVGNLSDVIHNEGDSDSDYIIKTNKIPLLYFFDKDLNENINISISNRNNFVYSLVDIYPMSKLNQQHIINISIDKHAVILYPFTYNERNYVYLSNSGLGIENQNTTTNKTSCKLFHVIGLDKVHKIYDMFLVITDIINLIQNFSPIDYLNDHPDLITQKDELHREIDVILANIQKYFAKRIDINVINKKFLSEFYKNILSNSQNKSKHIGYINLIYLLLNYLAQTEFMNECSFHHILWGNDYPIYPQLIRRLIYNGDVKFTFDELYINCINDYNSEVYRLLREEMDERMAPMSNDFINDINKKLDECAKLKKTIEFKRDSIIIELHNSGLYNYVQVGGSCVFYCFYNLLINNLFLTNYSLYKTNKQKAVENVINPLLYIHYTLLEHLCMCNDVSHLNFTDNIYPNQIFHMNYIYNIMIKNNLMEEITDFYPSPNLMIFSKTPLIDKLLDFKLIEDRFIIKENLERFLQEDVKTFKSCFNRIDTLFNEYLNKIRNLEDLNERILIRFRNQLYAVYEKIEELFDNYDFMYCSKYFNISRDIIIVYCYYLLKLYSKKIIIKKYIKKGDKINLLYPVYRLPSNIDLSNCGALNDCLRKRCDPNVYNCFYEYNIDYILNKFSNYEINCLSTCLKTFDVEIKTKITKLFTLDECNNISVGMVKLKQFSFYNNNIYFELDDHTLIMKRFISKYFRNKYLSVNSSITEEQRKKHAEKCNYIIEKLKESIKENIDVSSLSIFKTNIPDLINNFDDIDFTSILQILLFILSDGAFIFLSNETCFSVMFFNLMSLMNLKTEILYNTNSNNLIIEKIYFFLVKNTNHDISNDSIEKHSEWISKYNIIFDLGYNFFEYNGEKYLYELKSAYNGSISLILARFGLHTQNSDEYILLIPQAHLIADYILRLDITFTFFICIKKNKTIIEINIVDDKVDVTNCYLLKNEKRHKLEFNIQYPFFSFFTETTPYLCYTYNNTTYVDIILSSAFWTINPTKNYKYLLYKSDIDIYEYFYKFDILEFEMAYSLTFPTIKTNNIAHIGSIHYYYPTERILQFTKEQLVSQDISSDYTNIDKLTTIVKNIGTILCKNINCDQKTNEIFKQVFVDELTEEESRIAVLESFLKDNRLCVRFDFNDELIYIRSQIELELKIINDAIPIIHNFDKPQFIIDNLTNIIAIMEINELINELSKINTKTSCWDIQSLLTKLDSILLFNEDIKQNSYYLYELLFLFQNNYFFKENQLRKYKNIVDEMTTNNSSLTIHQFMMGKGKTSFLTPLLSMAIYLFTGKSTIVITNEHLVLQTISYMRCIHYLGAIPFNVSTDYEYKQVWLEKTDIELEKNPNLQYQHQLYIENISNTSLIIDEFNSHYDYTQSMFNLVKKQEYISEEMFNYIFDYIHSKIAQKLFVPSVVPELTNYEVFNQILDKELTIAITLKYNEKYGFTNIFGDIRLCIPYARKDTPLIGSRFSSIILTIILTLNYYITIRNYKLDEKYDYPLIVHNYSDIIKILPIDIFDEWYEYIQKNQSLDIDIIKTTFDKLYSNLDIYVTLLKKILYIINKPGLVFATEQYNVSFQDIIYNVYPNQWKVGYTGTIYLNPDIYFRDDTFVFKNKVEDFDERIEVKLALQGYGCSMDCSNNVVIINTDSQTTISAQLQTIISYGINRGIVDIAGLFIDYSNVNIAKDLQTLLPEKTIIYLSEKHEGLEYSETENNKYKPFHDDNFYYYDQCHIVGTDLEQPNEGCIAVIINKNTKWTEFSQGIFRFRKLNRGTHLKIFYITNSEEKLEKSLTNNDILELLEKNETQFEKGQELGIKFQLLKAMVRKLSKNYLEDSLINEFLLSKAVTQEDCNQFFINNIKDINRVLLDTTDPYFKYIYDLYQDIIANKDLIQLIIGSQSMEKQIDMEILENKDIQKLSVELVTYDDKITYQYDIITHLNCSQCIHTTSAPLFINDYTCFINGKPIYISINLALGFSSESIIDTTLLIFVELPGIIVLEIEYVAYDYYSHKFPIYDFKGNLLNIFLKNNISPHPFKLDIDYRILYLFGIANYINPIKEKNQYIITRSVIDDIEHNLNIEGAKLIFFLNRKLPITYKNLFDVSPIVQYIVNKYVPDDALRLIDIPEKDNNREHNPNFRLDNIFVHMTQNSNGIVLKTEVFTEIKRVPFQIIYDTYYHRLDTSLDKS